MNEIDSGIIKINIAGKSVPFEMLNCDKDKAVDIIKAFPDGLGKTLTPQLWWGNLEDPKRIILALNPSYRDSDVKDNNNSKFKDILNLNLHYNNRDEALKLNNLFNVFDDIEVLKTWMDDYKLKAFREELKDFAIYNMFGYHQTHLDKRNIELSHIKGEIKQDIIEKISKAKQVYFLWGGKEVRELWVKLLCDNPKNKEDELYNILMNKAKSVNGKNPFKPDFERIKNKEQN